MKKILTITIGILLHTVFAFGDEVDRRLSNMTTEQMMVGTRKMIDVGVPSEEAINITRLMIENRFRQQQAIRAQQVLVEAVEEALPIEPVMNKVHEGIAKGVPDERIVQAMEKARTRYSYAYRHARNLAQQRDRIRDIANAVAGCLAAGMNYTDADRIVAQLQERTRQKTRTQIETLVLESFRTARTMNRMGVHSDTAAKVVCNALQYDYSAQEMKQVQKSFVERSRNTVPEKVASQYSSGIERGQRAGNLGFGTGNKSSIKGDDDGLGASGGSSGSGESGGSSGSGSSVGAGGSGGFGDSGGSGDADGADNSGGSGDASGAGGSDSAGNSGSSGGGSGQSGGSGGSGESGGPGSGGSGSGGGQGSGSGKR